MLECPRCQNLRKLPSVSLWTKSQDVKLNLGGICCKFFLKGMPRNPISFGFCTKEKAELAPALTFPWICYISICNLCYQGRISTWRNPSRQTSCKKARSYICRRSSIDWCSRTWWSVWFLFYFSAFCSPTLAAVFFPSDIKFCRWLRCPSIYFIFLPIHGFTTFVFGSKYCYCSLGIYSRSNCFQVLRGSKILQQSILNEESCLVEEKQSDFYVAYDPSENYLSKKCSSLYEAGAILEMPVTAQRRTADKFAISRHIKRPNNLLSCIVGKYGGVSAWAFSCSANYDNSYVVY